MIIAVGGMGLVSPFGLSPREHVFFQRAHVPGPFPSPFVGADEAPVRVFFCPWLNAALPSAERIAALASAALDTALVPLAATGAPPPALWLCLARARPGLDARVHEDVTEALRRRYAPPSLKSFWAEAGVFAALKEAEQELSRNEGGAIVLVAVDSHVSTPYLTHLVQNPPTRWESIKPRPSEAAAALLLLTPKRAQQLRLPILARIHKSALAMGTSNDDNDAPADAVAMSAALRELGSGHVSHAFGQAFFDDLRREEWYRAVARQSTRFWDCQHDSVESAIGAVGAASGAANLVYGAAMLRLGAAEPASRDPFLAWTISRDGTRGVASASVDPA